MRLIAATTGSLYAANASVPGSNASPLLGRPFWFSFRHGAAASGAATIYDDTASNAGRERIFFGGASQTGAEPMAGPYVPACALYISLSGACVIALTRG